MQPTTKYRSLFTGRQIDEILQSVRDKLDKSAIAQSYSEGGVDKVVSAEAVKQLSTAFDNTFTPEGVRDLISNAPDSNVFTDADKRKVNGINTQFKGTVIDIASRDAIDTTVYTGGEVILVLRNSANLTEFQYWDSLTETWFPVNGGGAERDQGSLPTGTSVIASYDMTERSGAKYLVHGKSADGDSQVAEVLIASKLTNVSWTLYGDVLAGAEVFTLNVVVNGAEVELNVTTSQPSSLISIVKIAEF